MLASRPMDCALSTRGDPPPAPAPSPRESEADGAGGVPLAVLPGPARLDARLDAAFNREPTVAPAPAAPASPAAAGTAPGKPLDPAGGCAAGGVAVG